MPSAFKSSYALPVCFQVSLRGLKTEIPLADENNFRTPDLRREFWIGMEIGWTQKSIWMAEGGLLFFDLLVVTKEPKHWAMPQVQLPVFPAGATEINSEIGFECKDGRVVYLNGHLPVFTHEVDDLASFRFYTTQLIVNGTVTQEQIVKSFGVPLTTVKRYCRQYREQGAGSFYKGGQRRRGHRLTPERLVEVQKMLDEGQSVSKIAEVTGLLSTTLHKAIDHGRLKQIKKK